MQGCKSSLSADHIADQGITSCLCKHQKMFHAIEKEGDPIPCLNTELQPLDRLLPCFSLVVTSPVQNTGTVFMFSWAALDDFNFICL